VSVMFQYPVANIILDYPSTDAGERALVSGELGNKCTSDI
jgi:hypothetical protein